MLFLSERLCKSVWVCGKYISAGSLARRSLGRRRLRETGFSANHEVPAILAAAALSVLSSAKRPDSPLFITPAIDTTSSVLAASLVISVSPISAVSAVFSGASFGNVACIVKVPAVYF